MITGAFGTLSFINPWILAGLVFLPALWFLLRVTPPAPRLIRFPAARFLAGLNPEDHTTSKTPWWILLLRLTIAALVIMALARPVLNPVGALPGIGPVRLVMDNGWAAAQTWPLQVQEAASLIDRAGRARREIYILTTAPEPGKDKPAQQGPLSKSQAEAILNGLTPLPWPAAYGQAVTVIREAASRDSIASFWLSSGLQDGDAAPLLKQLQSQGSLGLFQPQNNRLPLLLRSAHNAGPDLQAALSLTPGTPASLPVTLQVVGTDGHVLDAQKAQLNDNGKPVTVTFDLPAPLRQQAGQMRIAGRQGAGAVLLLDDSAKRRSVGIAAPSGQEKNAPLIEASFYLHRALEPYADVITGTIHELLEKKPAALILPDIGALPPDELNALEKWVRGGGLLLRFGGPNMTQGEVFLTPVPIRKGGRALEGALTWDKPAALAPFPETSPYYGLAIPEDITIRQQILAEPVAGIEKMTWAALQDGTPLITAAPMDKGLLVLVHTTATAEWSDLALSGLFVQILKRTVGLAGSDLKQTQATGTLQPLLLLNGFGSLEQPKGFAAPIASEIFDKTIPSSTHPPGIYGRTGFQAALNLGDRVHALKSFDVMPPGVTNAVYGRGGAEKELMPQLLIAAFALFMADWLIMIALQTGFYLAGLRRGAAATLILLLLLPAPARAETVDDMVNHASSLYLAYVRTGVSAIDYTAYAGLEALMNVLNQRTSVEPAGIIAVDPAQDELAFYPFVYWPVAPGQESLSPEALRNVQSYLDHGGTILFDTRDQQSQSAASGGGANADALRRLTQGLNIPPLISMPKDHVLTKSFYLLKDFPGRYDGGAVWVEENSASGRDGVSSVIIGSHDWAAAWAAAGSSGPRLSGGPQQQEIALRFGVNLVIYALTGNYKADQVHMPHILERLGE